MLDLDVVRGTNNNDDASLGLSMQIENDGNSFLVSSHDLKISNSDNNVSATTQSDSMRNVNETSIT